VKGPIIREDIDQLRYDRAFEPECGVDHRVAWVIARDILATDVQPSRESDTAVDARIFLWLRRLRKACARAAWNA